MYEVLIERRAERELRKLPGAILARIARGISSLGRNPRPPGCRKIAGSDSDWRIRVGEYRVIYEIDDSNKIVKVFRVRHRKGAYR